MGDLGAKYGFYGEDPGMGGAGEAITLVDKTGEAWVFHICGGKRWGRVRVSLGKTLESHGIRWNCVLACTRTCNILQCGISGQGCL